jgi:uncharacterized protein YbcI
MKSSSAQPGSSLSSKPTWWKAFWAIHHVGFFCFRCRKDGGNHQVQKKMEQPNLTMAQQVAQAASAFQEQRTGHAPKSVTVVLGEDTLVITLHGALSPAEEALAKSPAGAAQVQDFHRELFANSCEPLRQEIQRITGVEVRESVAEIEPSTGTVVQVFSSGTMVQVFLLAHSLPVGAWNGTGPSDSLPASSQ